MEKTLRVLGDEDGDGHGHGGHSHSHSHSHESAEKPVGSSTAVRSQQTLRARKETGATAVDAVAPHESEKSTSGPSKMSAYLNLFGDFVHNM